MGLNVALTHQNRSYRDSETTQITLVTLYGPNKDEPQFFNHITNSVEKFNNNNIIICGDFNIALDQQKDTSNYKHKNNPKSHEALIKIMDSYELVDSFTLKNPKSKRYTWRNKSTNLQLLKQSISHRFFLVSTQLNNVLRGQYTVSIFCSSLTEYGNNTLYRDIYTEIVLNDYA